MTDETANLILEYMRRFERSLGDIRTDLREEGQALMNRRLDRLDERVTRIEKRLDLVEG